MRKNHYSYIMVLVTILITGFYSCSKEDSEGEIIIDELVLEKAFEVLQQVDEVYMDCRSITELEDHADEIAQIENVKDVYFTNTTMFVEIQDFMTFSFSFYPKQEISPTEGLDSQLARQFGTRAATNTSISQLGLETGVIIDNQPEKNQEKIKTLVKQSLDHVGIDTKIVNNPPLSFYEKELFENDVVFLLAHGNYNNKKKLHWIKIGEIFDRSQYLKMSWTDILLNWFRDESNYKGYALDKQISIDFSQETINGQTIEVPTICISEKFISAQQAKFKKEGKAIVYNLSCQSLKGGKESKEDKNERDFALAEAFVNQGAGVYFGYDETNGAGQQAGVVFFGSIASGLSVLGAYNSIPDIYKHNEKNDEEEKRSWTADLLFYPEDHFKIENSCQILPNLLDKSVNNGHVTFYGTEPYYMWIDDKDEGWITYTKTNFIYGFEVSSSEDFDPKETKSYGEEINTGECILKDNIVTFSYSVPLKDMSAETTYYYRAYLNDGSNKYYSKSKDFTTPQKGFDQVVPDSIRKKMEPYIPIYEGTTPPIIEGTYVIDPMEIVHDMAGLYEPGYKKFGLVYFNISNQDPITNTLDYKEKEISYGQLLSEAEGDGAFISGEGNNFSVYFNTLGVSHLENYDVPTKDALIISGTKVADGIKDLYYSFVMVEKGDDPENIIMNAGDFRVFKDGDNWAEITTWSALTRSQQIIVRDGRIISPWSKYSIKSH